MAYEHEGNMVNEFPVSGWKEYWDSLINENTAFRARVARLERTLRSITKLEHTATPGQMREIARRALEEK